MQIRVKLYILSFAGFMVNYMLRTDLNIAILAMARQDVVNVSTVPLNLNLSTVNVTQNYTWTPVIIEKVPDGVSHSRWPSTSYDSLFKCLSRADFQEAEFNWTNNEQNRLQTGFYWWYFISSGISSVFINRIGPSRTFGYGQFISGCGSLLIPLLAAENSIYVFLLRSIQGFAEVCKS